MRVKSQMKNSKRRAFTLVELLVVIAIIGILFVVLISKVDFATDKAKATGVQTDFRSYQLAIETVARENAGLSVLVDKDAEGDLKYAALEAALNKNLDPKLHVEIDANGKISTKAKDPWKEEYLGAYLAPDEDGTVKDRGAIIMYSKGSNLKLGTDAVITNGVVSTSLSDETAGKDDFKIAVVYTYANGYGEIQTTTEGFSNDMKGGNVYADNGGNVTPTPNPTPGEGNDPEQGGAQEPNSPVASEGLAYTLKGDGTYELSGIGECTDTDIVIPAEVDGKAVTSIGYDAFGECSSLTSIAIPDSVTDIYMGAFYKCENLASVTFGENSQLEFIDICAFGPCISLTSIELPNSLTIIEESAFSGCTGLTSIAIPDSVTTLVQHAFDGCSGLTSVTFGENSQLSIIQNHVFGDCTGLTSITIPDGVTSLADYAFYNCSGLTSVTIPDSITSVSSGIFEGCTNLIQKENGVSYVDKWVIDCDTTVTNVNLRENTVGIGVYAFKDCSSLTSITIPDSVTNICDSAFYGCSGLTNVIFGENSQLTNIGASAFRDCSSLASIDIPDGVTSIGYCAFVGCSSIANVTVEEGNSAYRSTGNCLIEIESKKLILGCNTSIIPNDGSVTIIADYAFENRSALTSVDIPDGVTSIGYYAFKGCSSLTSIVIPDSVTKIGGNAFSGCGGLESITLPFVGESVKTESETYQYPLGYIFGTSAYEGGVKTEQEYYWTGTNYTSKSSYYIPSSLKTVIITGGNILYGAFYGCSNLTNITIPEDITNIGNYAFYGCSNLTSIVIPGGVTNIGRMAFHNCSNLESVTFGENSQLTNIVEYAFYGCKKLTNVTFGGLKSQWNAITFGTSWNFNTGSYTIHCTDGDIAKF